MGVGSCRAQVRAAAAAAAVKSPEPRAQASSTRAKLTTVMTAPPTAAWNAQSCRFHIDDYRGDLRFRKPARSVLMPAGRVLVGDVPLHVAGVDSLHDTLAVVPSQTASGANGFSRLDVREAVAGSLVKRAPVARGLDATVVLLLLEKPGLDAFQHGLDLLELGLWRRRRRARFRSRSE